MTITAPHEPAPPAAPWLDVEPDFDDAPPELALTDRAGADRHLVAIDRIEREFALEQAGALAEIERIQQWIAGRFEATTAEADWHRSILHRYHAAVLAVGGPKTIKLPHGELQARAQQPSWEIDAPTFLAWARENLPEAVRPPKVAEPTVDVAAAKRLLTLTDEVEHESMAVNGDGMRADGVAVFHRPPKFSIVVAEDEPEPEREKPAERIVGVNWHSAMCVDDEGKVECCCGLDDLRDRAAEMHAEPPDDGEAYAQFQADQSDPGPDVGPAGDEF